METNTKNRKKKLSGSWFLGPLTVLFAISVIGWGLFSTNGYVETPSVLEELTLIVSSLRQGDDFDVHRARVEHLLSYRAFLSYQEYRQAVDALCTLGVRGACAMQEEYTVGKMMRRSKLYDELRSIQTRGLFPNGLAYICEGRIIEPEGEEFRRQMSEYFLHQVDYYSRKLYGDTPIRGEAKDVAKLPFYDLHFDGKYLKMKIKPTYEHEVEGFCRAETGGQFWLQRIKGGDWVLLPNFVRRADQPLLERIINEMYGL